MEEASAIEELNWKDIIIRGILSTTIPLSSIFYGIINKFNGKVYILQSSIDSMIPFNQYFILPYVFWYFYVGFFLFYLCGVDKTNYFKLLLCIVLGELICCLIFYFFPTYVARPNVLGDDFCSKLVRYIYKSDNPYNCFPSIHVLDSTFVAICVYKSNKFNMSTKRISLGISIIIIISTMFVKQHYFADIVSGALLAFVIYIVAEILYNHIHRIVLNKVKEHKKFFDI